jgi:hypothetical protein
MRNKKMVAVVLAAVTLAGAAACSKKASTPAATVSFSGDVQPILAANCAVGSNCHTGANNSNGHIDLSAANAYATIVQQGLVNTTKPTASMLYYETANGIMPKAPYAALLQAQESVLLNWISQGAKNN